MGSIDIAMESTLQDVKSAMATESTSQEILSLIKQTNSDAPYAGVEIDFTTNTAIRLGDAVGHSAGDAFFNGMSAFGGRRRCNIDNSGVVSAYYGDSAYTDIGSNVLSVMVEQPAFYYKVEPLDMVPDYKGKGYVVSKIRYYISDVPRKGFKIHPAFVVGDKQVSKIYLAAYRGSLWDTSAVMLVTDDSVAADSTADLLCSSKGTKPASGGGHTLTRDYCRKMAALRGTGWSIETIQSASMTQMLFMVEYASLNAQSKLGAGHTNGTWNETNDAQQTGTTSALGNTSGVVTTNNIQAVTYRGEEDLYGMWRFIDGMNIDNYGRFIPYINSDTAFADNKVTDNYTEIGFAPIPAQGYLSKICYSEKCDWAFMAGEVKGNSDNLLGDYFWNNPAGSFVAVALLGGGWIDGVGAGLAYWRWADGSGSSGAAFGARLLYRPIA